MERTALANWIARVLARRAGVEAIVEQDDHTIRLSGRVASEEARQAAEEIATVMADGQKIENDLEIEVVLPADLGDFMTPLPSAEVAARLEEREADVTDEEPSILESILASDDDFSATEDGSLARVQEALPEEDGEPSFPPTDPVVGLNPRDELEVIGGFESTSVDEIDVDPSAEDSQPGDEALADAVRRELREDAATTDLKIEVLVRRGIVYLLGPVDGPEDAEQAEEVAGRVPGAREVIDLLQIGGKLP
jgi:osmotically-inducible protein OsmY